MEEAKTRTLIIVAFIVFVDMLGIGLILPVMPALIRDVSFVRIDRAAEIGGFLLFAYAGMQFVFAPIIGGLSDRFGRRPVLLTTLGALGVDYCLMAAAPSLGWLFIGRMISGVMGATWAAANSCVADSVAVEKRGAAFGTLGGAGAAGFVFGPAIGGLAGEFGTRIPFIIAAVLVLSGVFAGFFLLQETLAPSRRRTFELSRANPVGSIVRMTRKPFVLGCLATAFFMQLSAQAQLSIWAYWGLLRFGWTSLISGLTVSLYGVLLGTAQAVLTGKCIARFGAARTARWSLCFGLPCYLLLAFAPSTPFVIAAILIGSLTGMTFPSLQSLMTARVDHDSQGELQGAIASTISLTSIIGPVVMTQTFAHFSDAHRAFFPGAPYLLSLGLLTVAIGILWTTLTRDRRGQLLEAKPLCRS